MVEKKNELSLLMLINRLQNSSEFQNLDLPEDYLKNLSENSTDELLDIIARVTATMLRHLDLPAERKKAREEGLAEGHAELARFTKLTQLLLEAGRTNDLARAVNDLEYRKGLYRQNNL